MTSEQQTMAAAAIVGLTAGIFLFRLLRKKKRRSCGSCGCGTAVKAAAQK